MRSIEADSYMWGADNGELSYNQIDRLQHLAGECGCGPTRAIMKSLGIPVVENVDLAVVSKHVIERAQADGYRLKGGAKAVVSDLEWAIDLVLREEEDEREQEAAVMSADSIWDMQLCTANDNHA